MEALELGNIDSLGLKIFVMLKRVIDWVEVVMWWTNSLLERGVLFVHGEVRGDGSGEIEVREEAVAWNEVVLWCGFIIPQMREAGGVGVRKVEWHVGVTIIDTIELLTVQEVFEVVLDDWALSLSSVLGSGSLSLNAITEGENVLISFVLKSVSVNINHAGGISDTSIDKLLMSDGIWVNVG